MKNRGITMRPIFLFLLCALLLSGCIPRVKTDIPAFSGTVIDSNSGLPLADVTIEEEADPAPEGWVPQPSVTGPAGTFSYPAVTTGKVYVLLAPGVGSPVRRILTFHKDGYRDTVCRCENMALFGEDNRSNIPLLQVDPSDPSPDTSVMLRVNDNFRITCQAFVGSRVLYEGKTYLIDEIYPKKGDSDWLLFSLQTIPPNMDESIRDVDDMFIQLTTENLQAEE